MSSDHGQPDHWAGEFRHCPYCSTRLNRIRRGGRLRMGCPSCEWVHFRNPAVGAAVLVVDDEGRVLLVRRARGATKEGRWCIPAGYVDYGEEVRVAAAREMREEAGLVVEVGEVLQVASNFHDPAKLSVGIWFAGRVTGGEVRAGDDADDAGWFPLDDLPELAFDTDRRLLDRLARA